MLLSAALYAQPVISNFSPATGATGTSVSITGSGFGTTAAENIVFFGAVRATVIAAATNMLTVTVPPGATYQPITVTVNGLIGYSAKPFITTFQGTPSFDANSFATPLYLVSFNPETLAAGDLDGDGKSDIVISYGWGPTHSFHIFRNQSTPGGVSFADPVLYPYITGVYPQNMLIADVSGDGKPDVIASTSEVAVYKNSSTPGNITFEPRLDISLNSSSIQFGGNLVTDIDRDGRPDIFVCDMWNGRIIVLRNTSQNNIVSFAAPVTFDIGSKPKKLAAADLDGDGLRDIAAVNNTTATISVLRNTSTPGNISFAPKLVYAAGSEPFSISAGDLNADDKPDLVVANNNGQSISLFKNTGSPGTVSFDAQTIISTGAGFPTDAIVCDLDGDGKPDIAETNNGSNTAALVFKNTGTGDALSFAPFVSYPTTQGPWSMAAADLDNDGKPDLTIANAYSNIMSVMRNTVNNPVIQSFSPATATMGQVVTITGANFTGTTGVLFGGVPAASFTLVSPTTITAVPGVGASGDVTVIQPGGITALPGFTYTSPVVQICPNGSTVFTSDITGAAYQWQLDAGNGFTNISNNANYSGTQTANLQLNNIPSAFYNYKYRCMVAGSMSRTFILRFANTWTGNVNGLWGTAANWSCGTMPDQHTDVVINQGPVVLNTHAVVRSLTVNPGVNFTVEQGYTLTSCGGSVAAGSLAGAPGACANVTANGVYAQGTALVPANSILVQVNVTTPGCYLISTNTVNGIRFAGSGSFNSTGVQTLVLPGTGVPAAAGNFTYTISWNASACSFSLGVGNVIATSGSYFPLTVNSNWAYTIPSTPTPTDSVRMVSLPATLSANGQVYSDFLETNEALVDRHIGYRNNGRNFYLYYDQYENTHSLLLLQLNGEIRQLNDSLPAGSTWSNNITGWVNGGSTTSTPVQMQATITEKGVPVTLLTGLAFLNAIKVKYNYYDMGNPAAPVFVYREERWFVPGVGMVYFQSADPFGIGVTQQLKRYQVY